MTEYQEALLEHDLVSTIMKGTSLQLQDMRNQLKRNIASIPLQLQCKKLNSELLTLAPMYNAICEKAIDGLEQKYGAKLDFLRVPGEPKENGKQ